MLEIKLNKNTFTLHWSGAAYWHEQDAVLLADVHLGKSAHFRKHGMAIPSQADDKEYDKLNGVITLFNPSRLWFLGDLFHSYLNAEWHFFEQWIRMQQMELALIMGNHDLISRDRFHKLSIKTFKSLRIGDIILTHHPAIIKNAFNIAGHIHPAVRLKGLGKQQVKLACFFATSTGLVLPSFGDFTGSHVVQPEKGSQIFGIVDDEVIELD